MAIDMAATDENIITLGLGLEHGVPPPMTPLKTHLISNRLAQRLMQLVVVFERSG